MKSVRRSVPSWKRRLALGIVLLISLAGVAADLQSSRAPAKSEAAHRTNFLNAVSAGLAPLAYGKDWVEVRPDHTLGRRYRHRGDWPAEVRDYLAEAEAQAAARPGSPRCLKLGCVFLKDARISFPAIAGADGTPLEATYSTPADFEEKMRAQATRDYADFIFAFSGGEVRVEWTFETVTNIHWVQEGSNPNWGCQPKAAGPQLERALARHRGAEIGMWVFCAGKPLTRNAAEPKQQMQGVGGGVSYTQWKLLEGYSLVTSVPDIGFLVHEINHRYLDNLEAIEGIKLTQFHGLGRLGYEENDLGYPQLLNTYRSVYLYIVRRDMWRRFTLTESNRVPREPCRGQAYRWNDVKHDCWFQLPELKEAELARLTGLPTLKMDAQKNTDYRLYTVAEEDRGKVLSPYTTVGVERDTQLNNLLALHTESCAVLKTATGHWLFVRPDLADLYVDMGGISGRGLAPLPVYGYLLEGIRPLLLLRAPPELPVPPQELGYFRPLL